MTTKLLLQKILKGVLHTQDENKYNHERVRNSDLKRRIDKYKESSIELAANTQKSLNKQTESQLNGRNSPHTSQY
jgi:hypothetical protein